jgi:hypothetical protein
MPALITITHRTVEHADPKAAGFVNGYWWTLSHDNPLYPAYVESASPTAQASELYARETAHNYGFTDDDRRSSRRARCTAC